MEAAKEAAKSAATVATSYEVLSDILESEKLPSEKEIERHSHVHDQTFFNRTIVTAMIASYQWMSCIVETGVARDQVITPSDALKIAFTEYELGDLIRAIHNGLSSLPSDATPTNVSFTAFEIIADFYADRLYPSWSSYLNSMFATTFNHIEPSHTVQTFGVTLVNSHQFFNTISQLLDASVFTSEIEFRHHVMIINSVFASTILEGSIWGPFLWDELLGTKMILRGEKLSQLVMPDMDLKRGNVSLRVPMYGRAIVNSVSIKMRSNRVKPPTRLANHRPMDEDPTYHLSIDPKTNR
jgi:hypothetical protein